MIDNKQIAKPSLNDVLKMSFMDMFANMNFHRIGKIENFNPATQTATISIMSKKIIVDNFQSTQKIIDIPVLSDVPVVIGRGQNGGITTPISQGDYVLLAFCDRDISDWQINGIITEPNNTNVNDLSDAIAIPFLYSEASPISSYNNNATEIDYKENSKITLNIDGIKQEVLPDASIELTNALASLKINPLGLVQLQNLLGQINITPAGLIQIKSSTQSLFTILNTLLTTLASDSGLQPSTQAQLTTLQTNLAQLFTA
jgi:hypothetical protein